LARSQSATQSFSHDKDYKECMYKINKYNTMHANHKITRYIN